MRPEEHGPGRSGRRAALSGLPALLLLPLLFCPAAASAQSLARFSLDGVAAIDHFVGENTADRPNIIVDITGVVRLGDGWRVYVRPWFRQPRAAGWDKQIYQAALQYERSAAISTRVDVGYIVSPIGLGMMDTRPGVNPTIAPHLSYFTPMPVFDPTAPRVQPLAATYPLGAQATFSTLVWDVRGALVNSAPTRVFVVNGHRQPRATPVVVAGAGITPRIGLRLGASFAHGAYATRDELTTLAQGDERRTTIVNIEGEYAFGYTRIAGELTRNRLETNAGAETAYAWFLQGVQTLTPRWFVAARQEGTSAPPLRSGIVPGRRTRFHTTEAAVGLRIHPELTVRASYMGRKPFTRAEWDQQAGVSLVWAHRWW